jgi:hypothetical protein
VKSHHLARALNELARILEAGPSVDVRQLKLAPIQHAGQSASSSMAINVTTLANLARIDKAQWLLFIRENGLPIPTRPRDASRDVLGKLLKYLESNPEARRKLKESLMKSSRQSSPELMQALSLLLGDGDDAALK